MRRHRSMAMPSQCPSGPFITNGGACLVPITSSPSDGRGGGTACADARNGTRAITAARATLHRRPHITCEKGRASRQANSKKISPRTVRRDPAASVHLAAVDEPRQLRPFLPQLVGHMVQRAARAACLLPLRHEASSDSAHRVGATSATEQVTATPISGVGRFPEKPAEINANQPSVYRSD